MVAKDNFHKRLLSTSWVQRSSFALTYLAQSSVHLILFFYITTIQVCPQGILPVNYILFCSRQVMHLKNQNSILINCTIY